MKERIEDLIPIYALGGLSAEERGWVEEQIAGDPLLATQLASYSQIVEQLACAPPPLAPSVVAEEDLFTRIAADKSALAAAAPVLPSPGVNTPTASFWNQLKRLFYSPAVSGAALSFAAILLIWAFSLLASVQNLTYNNDALISRNNGLQAQVDDLLATNGELIDRVNRQDENYQQLQAQVDDITAQTVAYAETIATNETELASAGSAREEMEIEIVALMAELELAQGEPLPFTSSEMYAVTIPGTELQPQAEAQLVVDPETQMAMLVVTGMENLPENSVYQVLLIRGTEHETAQTFRVDTEGERVLLVNSPQPLDSFDAVGVSIEPEGGSVQRTGDIVLLGRLIN